MYQKILIPIDNSDWSRFATSMGINLADRFGSSLVGLHVYAARLHDHSFRKLEAGLPGKYQGENLLHQRMVHDSLITKGLQLITESYLKAFAQTCTTHRVTYETKMREGKNFMEIIAEVRGDGYDLVVIGANGLGKGERSIIGSVCERVVRAVKTDVLVIKNSQPLIGGKTLVAIDGSPYSFKALRNALGLVQAFDMNLEVITVFDPYFHKVAFRSLAHTLTPETTELFKLKDQERLHDEITDKGLKMVARSYLESAEQMAEEQGIEMKAGILEGKPFQEILKYIEKYQPNLLVMGRFGTHRCALTELGSQTENLLRLSPINQLIVGDGHSGRNAYPNEEGVQEMKEQEDTSLHWTEGALKRLESVPEFIREMTKYRIEIFAKKRGYTEITDEAMSERYQRWGEEAGDSGFSADINWKPEAREKIERIPPHIRSTVIKEIEAYARSKGFTEITENLIAEAKMKWKDFDTFHESLLGKSSYHEARKRESDLIKDKN